MSSAGTPLELIELVQRATAGLTATAHAMETSDVAAPSGLPGWSRGHVLTHLANNAEGLVRLLLGTQSGRPLPMYASVEGRNADIAAGATRSAAVIVGHLDLVNASLDAAISVVGDWGARAVFSTVGGAAERPLPDVLRMRLREVAIHHVDLATRHQFIDEDPDVVRSLVVDAAERLSTDSSRTIDLFIDGAAVATIAPPEPAGPSAVVDLPGGAMIGWLTGRSDPGLDLPALPRWG